MSKQQREVSARRSLQPPKPKAQADAGRRIEATLRFITPMFGGGVKLSPKGSEHIKMHDSVTPVRGASLRGQLRTWWRRTNGQGLDLKTLQAREAVLWGWASTQDAPAKGIVSIAVDGRKLQAQQVDVYEQGNPKKPIDGFGSALGYGAFPLQPAQGAPDQNPGRLTRFAGDFTVQVELLDLNRATTYREAAESAWRMSGEALQRRLWDEVERSWAAFITFGGLGGRTRRGFGAVTQTQPAPVPLAEVAKRLGWTDRIACFEVQKGAEQAQKDALGKLQSFRQAKGLGRNTGSQPNKPGRSRWPEPDELRRITKQQDSQHAPVHAVRKFPRAAFGMPIIFHFQSRQDPADQSLQPRGAERLASPLILRPVVVGARCFAVALKLPSADLLGPILVDLELRNNKTARPNGTLSPDDQGLVQPLKEHRVGPEGGANAVLNPFLRYFQS